MKRLTDRQVDHLASPEGRTLLCLTCGEVEYESGGCNCTSHLDDCPCGLRGWTKIGGSIVCFFCRNLGEDDGYADGLAGRLPQRLDHTDYMHGYNNGGLVRAEGGE